MDQRNSDDVVLQVDAPKPIPPGANIAQGDTDSDSQLPAPNPIPPGPNTAQGGPSQDPVLELDAPNPIPTGHAHGVSAPNPIPPGPNTAQGVSAPNPIPPGPSTAQGAQSQNPVNKAYLPLLKAVRSGDLDDTVKFINDHPEAVTAPITPRSQTALHIATLFGHLHIVRKLVQLMSKDDLLLMDEGEDTALAYAIVNPANKISVNAAKCMVEKNENLVTIPVSSSKQLPITLATKYDHIGMVRYIYYATQFEVLPPENRPRVEFLSFCVICKIFDVALDLITRYPTLLETSLTQSNFWLMLVVVGTRFQSEIQLPFWKRWLHNWLHVHQEPASNITKTTERTADHYVSCTSHGTMKIYEASLAHKQYLKILQAACDSISHLNEEEINKTKVPDAVEAAARLGNPEFIMEAVTMNLTLLWTCNKEKRHLFQLAVLFRHAKVFNLVHGLVLRHTINFADKYGNNILHMAGMLAPPKQLNHISGALLQMQRELQWFKKVEIIMSPLQKDFTNHNGLTARELFTREHKNLVKEGEKWTKGTANSCSVIAALVVTITFAVAFTVPGGNDQTTGYPIFLHKSLFMVFAISNAVSLFSSSTSLLMFLGLLTSRYAEEDFLKSLPKRLIIGLSTMFISIATMMITFCAALFLMLQNQYSWIVIPVTVLASVPVTLYIWLQVPLLVEIVMSTYGPGIFDRNVKPWP